MKVPESVDKFRDMPDRFVFKKCKSWINYKVFLVVLEKPKYVDTAELKPFLCNESRVTIFGASCAKYRCNGLIPRMIVNLEDHILRERVIHFTQYYDATTKLCQERTLYKVDQLVTPSNFDTDVEEVCAPGIHYFLTLEAAVNYVF